MMNKYNTIIIVGPTACGKTGLSLELAKALKTEVIGADSQQVYKDLNIGTAKVTEIEKQNIKHHMIDIVSPESKFSVADYKDMAMPIIENLIHNNKIPIIVGGTGFYIDAIIGNNTYGQCPANSHIRQKYEQLLEQYGNEHIYSILEQIDPETAKKLHKNDIKRIIRALEIFETTGKTKSQHEKDNQALCNSSIIKPFIVGLNLSTRDKLYNKINNRVDIMFDNGLEEEIKALLESGLDRNSQSLQAIGYKEFFDYIDNMISLIDLKDLIKLNTRHYAKRQITYFKRLNIAKWYNTDELTTESIVQDLLNQINN